MNSKYSKLLTIILIIAIVIVVILFAFFGYEIYNKYYVEKQTSDMIDVFESSIADKVTNVVENTTNENEVSSGNVVAPILSDEPTASTGGSSSSGGTASSSGVKYKGYTMVGQIEIPKINIKYPILGQTTKTSIEVAVSVLYGPGPNKVGNTVIVGHNYKNGTFFSNNKKLAVGDEIYITDTEGQRMKYIIFDTQLLAPEDFNYAVRDTQGKREISLSTCTDDVNSRLVIFAREA